MLYNALSNGEENLQNCPFLWDFVIPPEDRATAIGNMHKNVDNDLACGSGDILADRQTDTHTETCSLQYFVPLPRAKEQLAVVTLTM